MGQQVSFEYSSKEFRFGREVKITEGGLKGRTGELVEWDEFRVWVDIDGETDTFRHSQIKFKA